MADSGGGDSNEVLIKVRYELDELKKGQGKLTAELEKTKKKAEKAFGGKKAIKEMTAAIKELTTVIKAQGGAFDRTEKDKQTSLKRTNKEIDLQKKKLQDVGKFAQSRTGRFLASFAAGAGVGGMRQSVTAEKAGGFAGRMLSRGVGQLAGFAMSGISQAYETYVQYGMALGGLVGLGNKGGLKQGSRLAGKAKGARLGYSMIDTAQQAAGIGRATGSIGAVYKAQQFSRATGMDVGEVGGYMGMLRQAGYGFGGRTRAGGVDRKLPGVQTDRSGEKALERIVAAGIYSGIERARLPEFIQGVANITQAAGARTSRAVDSTKIASFNALLGQSGLPGFQGARGAAVAQQLMQSTVTPGGGEAGQSMMLQALGFGKPGGQTSYYGAMKQQQQGLERPENVAKMFKEVYSQLGVVGKGGSADVQQEANLALSEMTGLSLQQIEDLGEILNSGKNAEEQMGAIKEQLKKSEPIEKQALKAMKEGFGGTIARVAGVTDAMIGIGGKFAPVFEKVQDLQIKLLQLIAKWLPEAVKWIKETYLKLSMWADKAMEGLFGNNAQEMGEYLKKKREEYGEVDPYFKGTMIQRMQAMKKQEEIDKKAREGIQDKIGGMARGEWGHGVINYMSPWLQAKMTGGTEYTVANNALSDIERRSNQRQQESQVMSRLMAANPQYGGMSESEMMQKNPAMARVLNRIRWQGGAYNPEQEGDIAMAVAKAKQQYGGETFEGEKVITVKIHPADKAELKGKAAGAADPDRPILGGHAGH